MANILFKQQQEEECLVFSQWLGPRAQRSLCLLFQLEEAGFTLVRKLSQRPGKRPEVTAPPGALETRARRVHRLRPTPCTPTSPPCPPEKFKIRGFFYVGT